MREDEVLRPIFWIGSSKRDLAALPGYVKEEFGFGLFQAQKGKFPEIGKTLSGFGSGNVIELISDWKGDTFRAVFTVRFSEAVIVLHVFQKKSKKGSETPKQDMELIRTRLKQAEEFYKEWKNKRQK